MRTMGNATDALEDMAAAYNGGNLDEFAAGISSDLTFSDHCGETALELSGRRLFVGGAKRHASDGFTRFDADVIDTRGDAILARIAFRRGDGTVDERLAVYQFDQNRTLAQYDCYGVNDIRRARARLERQEPPGEE